jgi:hypothetical protein
VSRVAAHAAKMNTTLRKCRHTPHNASMGEGEDEQTTAHGCPGLACGARRRARSSLSLAFFRGFPFRETGFSHSPSLFSISLRGVSGLADLFSVLLSLHFRLTSPRVRPVLDRPPCPSSPPLVPGRLALRLSPSLASSHKTLDRSDYNTRAI